MDSVRLVVGFAVDDGALTDLHAQAFGNDPGAPEPWGARLARHSLCWIGAFDGPRLVGFVHACWDGGRHAFLLDTVVASDAQGHGIGRALVRELIQEVHAAGCEWLHVDYEPHLEGFYLGCGFGPTTAGLLRL